MGNNCYCNIPTESGNIHVPPLDKTEDVSNKADASSTGTVTAYATMSDAEYYDEYDYEYYDEFFKLPIHYDCALEFLKSIENYFKENNNQVSE